MKYLESKFFIFFGLILLSLCLSACTAERNVSNTASNANSTADPNLQAAAAANSQDSKNSETNMPEAEKEKLQKEREKLEKEKQNLKDEKSKNERLQGAMPPSPQQTDTVMTLKPPVNIRDSPNGKVLCVVKKEKTFVKIYGSTEIEDNNGEWFYTKHCGKLGVIHSTQFVVPS